MKDRLHRGHGVRLSSLALLPPQSGRKVMQRCWCQMLLVSAFLNLLWNSWVKERSPTEGSTDDELRNFERIWQKSATKHVLLFFLKLYQFMWKVFSFSSPLTTPYKLHLCVFSKHLITAVDSGHGSTLSPSGGFCKHVTELVFVSQGLRVEEKFTSFKSCMKKELSSKQVHLF